MKNKIYDTKISRTFKIDNNYNNCKFGGYIANVNTLKSVEFNVSFWMDGTEVTQDYVKKLFRQTKKVVMENTNPLFYNRFISIQDSPFQMLENRNVYNSFVFNLFFKENINHKEVPNVLKKLSDRIYEDVFQSSKTRKKRNG